MTSIVPPSVKVLIVEDEPGLRQMLEILFQREGYLFELPVTWYVHPGSWDASPGYEQYREVRLDRAIEFSCLSCHASQVRPLSDRELLHLARPFHGSAKLFSRRCATA